MAPSALTHYFTLFGDVECPQFVVSFNGNKKTTGRHRLIPVGAFNKHHAEVLHTETNIPAFFPTEHIHVHESPIGTVFFSFAKMKGTSLLVPVQPKIGEGVSYDLVASSFDMFVFCGIEWPASYIMELVNFRLRYGIGP